MEPPKRIFEMISLLEQQRDEYLSRANNLDPLEKLSLDNISNRIQELRSKLSDVKRELGREIFQVRLFDNQKFSGYIDLDILILIATGINESLHATISRKIYGIDRRTQQFQKDEFGLRLDGLYQGSTKVRFSIKSNPDLFGYSDSEEALNSLFELLLSSDNPSEFGKLIFRTGIKSTKGLSKILTAASKSKSSIELSWDSISQGSKYWKVNWYKAGEINSALNNMKLISDQNRSIIAELITISVKGRIEIKSDARNIKCTFGRNLLPKMQLLHIGSTYSFITYVEKFEQPLLQKTFEEMVIIDVNVEPIK